jgi:type II secretory pathway pseudopilin PulG
VESVKPHGTEKKNNFLKGDGMKLNKKGFTLVEIMIVLGVVVLIIGVVLFAGRRVQTAARITAAAQQIQQTYGAGQTWVGNGRTAYTGISLATLQGIGYIPKAFSSPWGGAYAVAVNSADVSRMDITATNIPSKDVHDRIAVKLGEILLANSYVSGTSSFTF